MPRNIRERRVSSESESDSESKEANEKSETTTAGAAAEGGDGGGESSVLSVKYLQKEMNVIRVSTQSNILKHLSFLICE